MSPRDVFDAAYLRTCRALAVAPDADHADECYRAVQGYRASLYDAAATRLNANCRFLPKPAEWLEAVRDLALEAEQEDRRARELVAHADRSSRTYHCPVCQDTGFEMKTHPAGKCPICPRTHLYEAEWATECLCRPTNPVWQEKCAKRRDRVQGVRASGRAA